MLSQPPNFISRIDKETTVKRGAKDPARVASPCSWFPDPLPAWEWVDAQR